MKYQSYGDETGQLVFYFHGAPGGVQEAAFLEDCAIDNGLHIVCLDRFSLDAEIVGNAYYRLLSDSIIKHMDTHVTKPTSVGVIGFSIGCHVALEVCDCLNERVHSLDLISAAAPLDAGDFIDHMAGKPVFQLASKFPLVFKLLTLWQAIVLRLSPKTVFNMLFASAQGQDKQLASDPLFQAKLMAVLSTCYLQNSQGYMKDVFMYVQPWKHRVAEFSAPTTLWHGEADNWSPVAMADYLERALPNCEAKHVLVADSHYSCLMSASPRICKGLKSRG